jgi:hypothetical protein
MLNFSGKDLSIKYKDKSYQRKVSCKSLESVGICLIKEIRKANVKSVTMKSLGT